MVVSLSHSKHHHHHQKGTKHCFSFLMGRREKKAQAVIVQFFVHGITLSSEIQESWCVQRVCVSCKFADNADAVAALKELH